VRLRSLYIGTLAALVSILALSFLVFHAISDRMQRLTIDPVFDRADELQLESERSVLTSNGPAALKAYLANLNHLFGGSHYLLDAQGIDVLTGESHSVLLPRPPAIKSRLQAHGLNIITHRSQDGEYWFLAIGLIPRPRIWVFLPYYFLVIGATGILCWLAAVGVVSPIRRIASTIALFGQGDLSARVHTRREDEIGQLGRSFNQMAERLENLIVSERRLLSDISHELRSPLARLKFAVKLARTSPDIASALDRVERDVDRITALVADIVDITFAEADPALRGATPIFLSEVVEDVMRDCAVEAEARRCRLQLSGSILHAALGNRELLRRAVENVVRNAIRYSPEQSTVDVSLADDGREATIAVRDFGPGVPEDAVTRIFDPFYRVEEARHANGGGSGLGLSIARRAIEVHHGTITASNAHPGLRVEMRVPLVSAPLRLS
jgi:signal transduction histidine kinase